MADSFDCFSVLFGKGEVFVNGKTFPLGQCTTDILNIDGEVLAELDRRIEKLMPAVQSLLQEKTDSAARSAQEQLSAVWDLIFSFPVYRDLNMDTWTANNLFPLLLSDPEKWAEVQEAGTENRFVPMAYPTERGKALLAEQVQFSYLTHFLYTDFYRGLMVGNAPRRVQI